jgi:hypothetical protein
MLRGTLSGWSRNFCGKRRAAKFFFVDEPADSGLYVATREFIEQFRAFSARSSFSAPFLVFRIGFELVIAARHSLAQGFSLCHFSSPRCDYSQKMIDREFTLPFVNAM